MCATAASTPSTRAVVVISLGEEEEDRLTSATVSDSGSSRTNTVTLSGLKTSRELFVDHCYGGEDGEDGPRELLSASSYSISASTAASVAASSTDLDDIMSPSLSRPITMEAMAAETAPTDANVAMATEVEVEAEAAVVTVTGVPASASTDAVETATSAGTETGKKKKQQRACVGKKAAADAALLLSATLEGDTEEGTVATVTAAAVVAAPLPASALLKLRLYRDKMDALLSDFMTLERYLFSITILREGGRIRVLLCVSVI